MKNQRAPKTEEILKIKKDKQKSCTGNVGSTVVESVMRGEEETLQKIKIRQERNPETRSK